MQNGFFAKQIPGRTRRRTMRQIAFLPSAESRKTKPAAMKKVLFAKQMPGRTRRRIMGQIAFLPSVESRKTKPAAMKKVLFAKQMPGRTRLPDAGPALVPPFGRPLAYASRPDRSLHYLHRVRVGHRLRHAGLRQRKLFLHEIPGIPVDRSMKQVDR